MTSFATRDAATAAPVSPRSGPLLTALLVGQFMAVLDVTIVNVAAARIGTDLHSSGAGLQFVVSGYTVSYAVLLVAGARLGDRYGHGRAFRLGLAGFTVMSLLCGLAPTPGTLIAFRVLQGVGAAMMMPQVMSLIQRTFAGSARHRALSLYAAVLAGGTVVGQVVGGLLVSADVLGTGWRPVFLINVPIGLALLVLARHALPHDRGNPDRHVDLPGTAVLSAAVLLLVLPLVLGHELGWPAWCYAALALSAVGFVAFGVVERGVERRGGSPILSRHVLRAPGLLLGAAVMLLTMATYGGYLFTTALHLQAGLGESPAHAGLVFAPAAIGFALTGLTWQHLPRRAQRPMIPVGFAITALAYLALGLVFADGDAPGVRVEVLFGVLGLALGMAYSPVMGRALRHVPIRDAADASGVLVTVIQLGQLIGVAAFGSAYLSLASSGSASSFGSSSHAVAVTLVAVGACLAVAVALSVRLVTRRVPD